MPMWFWLGLCLLLRFNGSAAWAGEPAAAQVMLVLDVSAEAKDAKILQGAAEAAALLAHLLSERHYLGLAAPGGRAGVLLPPAPLRSGQRSQFLGQVARLTPERGRKSLAQVINQATALFPADGPKRRVLFLLTDAAAGTDSPTPEAAASDLQHLAGHLQTAGVAVFAAAPASGAALQPLRSLASGSSGRLWELKTAAEFPDAALKFFAYLEQPQEVPLDGEHFLIDPWVKEVVVAAPRAVPGKGVVLTSPRGARLVPAFRTRNLRWIAGQEYDLITVSQPQAGVWTLTQARLADTRVFLSTPFTLVSPQTPQKVGVDEALQVAAALTGHPEPSKVSDLLSGTLFFAEMSLPGNPPETTQLRVREIGRGPGEPPELRVGRFPPPHPKGEGTLRVWAFGKTFQRLISIPLTVTDPWYHQVGALAGEKGQKLMRFQPAPNRPLERAEGVVTVKSGQGGLSGIFITPGPGREISLALPAGCGAYCQVELHLRGTGPGGRPLEIASSLRTESPPKELDKKVQTEPSAPQSGTRASAPKPRRRWFWLALSGLGVAVFLASASLLFYLREKGENAEDSDPPKGSGRSNLSLKAQVEILTKEKAHLQEALNEAKNQIKTLQAEKSQLEEVIKSLKEKSQDNTNSMEELQKKLEEAEREAHVIRQEYMTLYARSQQEKDILKKN
ncbi:MAG: hypothetical protein ACUVXF_02440 [Desulfobaccales bacterium]